MVKRTLMALGLGAALLGGGAATAVHASSHVSAHPAKVSADLVVGATGAQTAEPADSATDPAGGPNDQSGDQVGSQDNTGPDVAEAPAAGDAAPAGPNTDTVQQGDQSGAN